MSTATIIFGLNGLAWRTDLGCTCYVYHTQKW